MIEPTPLHDFSGRDSEPLDPSHATQARGRISRNCITDDGGHIVFIQLLYDVCDFTTTTQGRPYVELSDVVHGRSLWVVLL